MNAEFPSTQARPALFPGRAELVPVVMVLAAVAILILPIPAAIMDLLLSANIALAMVLLLMAIRVGDALKVASLPTLLLVSTLFRLALNVSTTRLILGQADAGEVVRAFGSFVTGANPLVGGVVFLILTVVQFIVISKGAERVAEVTARFVLDAMPGKQMSIDADMRAGTIDAAQAGQRRMELERESQFFGAMDGAMKFVKGDALAGMVITAVNILGGLLVGCLQRGMSLPDAIHTYTLLTIGDGLVSQIPALLVATAAGLVVTRVKAENQCGGLGNQMLQQIGSHPEVILLAGASLIGIGLVPGMPLLVFGILGAMLTALGISGGRRLLSQASAGGEKKKCRLTCPVRLQAPAGHPALAALSGRLEQVRLALRDELGIPIGPLAVQDQGPAGHFTLFVDDVPVAGCAGGREPEGEVLRMVEEGLRRSAARFIGVQQTQDLLDELERTQPALVREVVPRLVPPVLLAEVLGRLVEEGVPVRNLRLILESLAEWARIEAEPMMLTERVRESMRAIITHRNAPDGTLPSLLLDPAVEDALQHALNARPGGTTLALAPVDVESILTGLQRALDETQGRVAVVLCRPEIRRPFWKLISSSHPSVVVVSYMELLPGAQVQPLGRICLAA